MCLLCLCARLFICALWSPASKGLTSWLSFVVSYCGFVTFTLVSWVRCGTWLYRFPIFAPFLTLSQSAKSGFLMNACSKAHLLRGKKLSTPVSFLASSIALFRANNAAQLIHIGGSPTAETVWPMLIGPPREKTCLQGFQLSEFQISLISYRDQLVNWNSAWSKFTYITIQNGNNKGADQTARMRRLVCACVVHKPPKTGFLASRPKKVTVYHNLDLTQLNQ